MCGVSAAAVSTHQTQDEREEAHACRERTELHLERQVFKSLHTFYHLHGGACVCVCLNISETKREGTLPTDADTPYSRGNFRESHTADGERERKREG